MYNLQRNSDVNHIVMKMRWQHKMFPSLNFVNGNPCTQGSKGILRHHNYHSDPKLGTEIIAVKLSICSFHA